jgi:hypothetical protein
LLARFDLAGDARKKRNSELIRGLFRRRVELTRAALLIKQRAGAERLSYVSEYVEVAINNRKARERSTAAEGNALAQFPAAIRGGP